MIQPQTYDPETKTWSYSKWDREKQNYFIIRRTSPWSVRNMDGAYICDYPTGEWDTNLLEKVCMAKNDESVTNIIKEYNNGNSTCSL